MQDLYVVVFFSIVKPVLEQCILLKANGFKEFQTIRVILSH